MQTPNTGNKIQELNRNTFLHTLGRCFCRVLYQNTYTILLFTRSHFLVMDEQCLKKNARICKEREKQDRTEFYICASNRKTLKAIHNLKQENSELTDRIL